MSEPEPGPKPKDPYDRYDDEAKGFKLGPPPKEEPKAEEEPEPEPKPEPPAAGKS